MATIWSIPLPNGRKLPVLPLFLWGSRPRLLLGWSLQLLCVAGLATALVAYALFFSRLSLLRHETLNTHTLDLGTMDQAIWNTLHGQPFRITVLQDVPPLDFEVRPKRADSYLAYHVVPLLFPLAQLYRWWPGPETLLVLQSWVIALGAVPAYLFARHRLRSPLAGLAFSGAYLLAPALQAANLTDFDPISMLGPLVFVGAYAVERRWYPLVALCGLLLLTLREDLSPILAAWGLAIALSHRSRWGVATGLSLLMAGLGWFWLTSRVIIPAYSGQSEPFFLARYTWLGKSAGEIASRILHDPTVLWPMLSRPQVVTYVQGLLESVGYLALLSPFNLLPVLPTLMANVLSTLRWMFSEGSHYSVALVPFLVVAAVYGTSHLVRLGARLHLPTAFATAALSLLVLGAAWDHHRDVGVSPWVKDGFQWPEVTEHHRKLAAFLARIPPDAGVSAQSALVPHLSQRAKIYMFPGVRDAEYILLDVTSTPFPTSFATYSRFAKLLMQNGTFGIVAADDGYLLLQRGVGGRDLPPEFFTFSRGTVKEVRFPLLASFGDELQLLGLDYKIHPVVDQDSRPVSIVTYWRALRKPTADYQVALRFIGRQGEPAGVYQSGTPTTTWLPTSLWNPGDIVRVSLPRQNISDFREVWLAVVKSRLSMTVANRLPISEAPEDVPLHEEKTMLVLLNLQDPPQAGAVSLEALARTPIVVREELPPRVWTPVCGRVATDGAPLKLRPLIVKIDNYLDARPQSGLSRACMVFELMTEGGITRFDALYYGEEVDRVGPIRSARLSDAELSAAYKAFLAHVGGSGPVLDFLRRAGTLSLDQFRYAKAYWRSPDQLAPHNVYASTLTLRDAEAKLGWGEGTEPVWPSFLPVKEAPGKGDPATAIKIPYSSTSAVSYEWDPKDRVYRRFILGQPHRDALNGEQLLAANVVLLFTEAWPATEIIKDPTVMSLQFRLWGEGTAWFFHDGRRYKGRWQRQGPTDTIHFLDIVGNPLSLRSGNIWVQVVTPEVKVEWDK